MRIQRDWSNNPQVQSWFDEVRQDLVPKLQDSAATVSIVPGGEPDVKFAVELGMSIMLDKPIILVADGRPIPAKLRAIASAIVEGDFDHPLTQQKLASAINLVCGSYRHSALVRAALRRAGMGRHA